MRIAVTYENGQITSTGPETFKIYDVEGRIYSEQQMQWSLIWCIWRVLNALNADL